MKSTRPLGPEMIAIPYLRRAEKLCRTTYFSQELSGRKRRTRYVEYQSVFFIQHILDWISIWITWWFTVFYLLLVLNGTTQKKTQSCRKFNALSSFAATTNNEINECKKNKQKIHSNIHFLHTNTFTVQTLSDKYNRWRCDETDDDNNNEPNEPT